MKPSEGSQQHINLDGIMEYAGKPRWIKRFDATMEAHTIVPATSLGIGFRDVVRVLGEPWSTILFYEVFNDFFTRRFGPNSENIVNSYIHGPGRNEPERGKEYLRSLRNSQFGLYRIEGFESASFIYALDFLGKKELKKISIEFLREKPEIDTILAARIVYFERDFYFHGGLIIDEQMLDVITSSVIKDRINIVYQGRTCSLNIGSDEFSPLITNLWIGSTHPKFAIHGKFVQ